MGRTRVLNTSQVQEVISRYSDGESITDIAKYFPVTYSTIYHVLKRNQVSTKKGPTGCKINHNAFVDESEHTSYWIGFLLADGCINKNSNRSYQITLELSNRDQQHVYKFKNFLDSKHSVRTNKTSTHFTFHSTQIAKSLEYYGVVPNKSLIANPKNINNKHFWRGVVDGDGSLWTRRGHLVLKICGTFDVCKKFKKFVQNFCNSTSRIHEGNGRYYYWSTEGKYAIDIANKLYKKSNIYLDRKYKIAKKFI